MRHNRYTIDTVEQQEHRYNTLGDWYGTIITVTELANPKYIDLIAIHELVEMVLCRHAGITPDMVDEWDMKLHPDAPDPGTIPDCPYGQQHAVATMVEQMVCGALGLDWTTYLEETS